MMNSNCKKRRRTKRNTFMTADMRAAVRRFAEEVGPPKGHRDFRSWLAKLRHPRYRKAWEDLAYELGRELFRVDEAAQLTDLQEEVVREVIKCVVKPRCDESDNIVRNVAYRHAIITRSGNTLRSVFQSQLAHNLTEDDPRTRSSPDLDSAPLGTQKGSNDSGDTIRRDWSDVNKEDAGRNNCDGAPLTRTLPSFRDFINASLSRQDLSVFNTNRSGRELSRPGPYDLEG